MMLPLHLALLLALPRSGAGLWPWRSIVDTAPSGTAAVVDAGHKIGCPAATTGSFGGCNRTALRLAAYNAEWLFDGVGDEMSPWQSEREAGAHLAAVASTLGELGADVVALAEVEDCFMLQRLAATLNASHSLAYTPLLQPGTDSATRQQVGLLSCPSAAPVRRSDTRVAWPVAGSGCGYHGKPQSTAVSKHLLATLAVPGLPGGRELLLVIAHLKARPNEPRSCAQREAQAAVLAQLVREHGLEHRPPRHVALLGDLNDFDGALPDAADNRPRSGVLRLLTEGLGLRNVAARLIQRDRWTWEGKGHPRAALDHILLSDGLWPLISAVAVGGGVGGLASPASDHRPLMVTLQLEPSGEPPARRELAEITSQGAAGWVEGR
jgi:endonuclease/exonuclease/phosphatase family metal-dependent hydrolase